MFVCRICRSVRRQVISSCFSDVEIDLLSKVSFPLPPSESELKNLSRLFLEHISDDIVCCVVCDEFCDKLSSKLLLPSDLPSSFFEILALPDGKDGSAGKLSPLLASQYCVYSSNFGLNDVRFKGILLSPRGVVHHDDNCMSLNTSDLSSSRSIEMCSCVSKLRICTTGSHNNCFNSIFVSRKIPKFAIAQGNFIGYLPEKLDALSFGSRCLLRPVHSFGRLTSFYGKQCKSGGVSLKGHMYSSILDTCLVRKKIPISPFDVPIRVVVVSPFCSNEKTFSCLKLASTKSQYVIQPDLIKELLQLWEDIDNPVMKCISVDHDVLSSLPVDTVSPEMFFVDLCDAECSMSLLDGADVSSDGGHSLLRSSEEAETYVLTTSTSTCGSSSSKDQNDFSKVGELLNSRDPVGDHNSISSGVYGVRPAQSFVSDSDVLFFERHFPDLFVSGRGGIGERRKTKISISALVQHWIRLSTRQFQSADFVFPTSNMLDRKQMATQSFIRGRLPSHRSYSSGLSESRSVAYSRLSMTDLQIAGTYKLKCGIAASKGI